MAKKKIKYPESVAGYPTIAKNAWQKGQETPGSRRFAIRAMCLLCVGGSPKEVTACTAPWCPLFKFRVKG
jgi:hypothetical protein